MLSFGLKMKEVEKDGVKKQFLEGHILGFIPVTIEKPTENDKKYNKTIFNQEPDRVGRLQDVGYFLKNTIKYWINKINSESDKPQQNNTSDNNQNTGNAGW